MRHRASKYNSWCIALILYATSASSYGEEIKPFTTDGCSMFPDGTPLQNDLWLACCIEHDFAYWKGGTFEQRKAADKRLGTCVADLGLLPLGIAMNLGVRFGGTPFMPSEFRWGYGWSFPKGYGELTCAELKMAEEKKMQSGMTVNANKE